MIWLIGMTSIHRGEEKIMLRMESYYTKLLEQQEWAKEPIQLSLQLSLNKMMAKWTSNHGLEDYYVKPRFVEGYPSYLFREREDKRRINDRTENNICIFPKLNLANTVMEEVMYGYKMSHLTLSKKAGLFNDYLVYQESLFYVLSNGDKRRYLKEAVKRIRFFDMVADEEDDSETTVENAVLVMRDIHQSSANTVPLLAVFHVDEDYPHVHFLYVLDYPMALSNRELKMIPHIEQIIKPEYGESVW